MTTPATRLARDADRRQLLEALRALPVEQQTLLELHYWEEMDPAALAEVFETTAAAIRVRLHRARRALRDRLQPGPDEANRPGRDEADLAAVDALARSGKQGQ